jgi:hypothetical protein
MSYELQAFVPLLRCDPANATVQSNLTTMLMSVSGSEFPFTYPLTPGDFNNQTYDWEIKMEDGEMQAKGDVGYFAAVPTQQYVGNNTNRTIAPWWNSTQNGKMELYTLTGEIWIAIPKANNGTGNETQMDFINCHLYNSSLRFAVNFTDRVSNTTIIENQRVNDLEYEDSGVNDPYFAMFQEMSTFLIGSVSWMIDTLGSAYFYPNAELLDTNLANSAQVYYMNQKITEEADVQNQTYAPEQIRNISFAQDIEDFALNSSLSILSDVTLWYVTYMHFIVVLSYSGVETIIQMLTYSTVIK